MNWLAHVYLSSPGIEVRLGNLLADTVRGRDLDRMSPDFMKGVREHRAVDAFAEGHAAVVRSKRRIVGDYKHLRGVMVDVFYDHVLAIDWERHSSEPFDDFVGRFYDEVRAHRVDLPDGARTTLERMLMFDPLRSFRHLSGIEGALQRVSARLTARTGREFRLETGVGELTRELDGFREDFAEFLPQVRAHLGGL